MKLTLSQALKFKNRIASELKTQEDIFKRENSRKSTSTSTIKCEVVYDNIKRLKSDISTLKSEISNNSGPIQYKIIYIGELRGLINNLKTVSKTDGEITSPSYGREPLKEIYNAFITESKADSEIESIQKEIDKLQDEIDSFNSKTHIEIKLTDDNIKAV